MRVLVISTYPPKPCGVARYAQQACAKLRSQGHVVGTMSVDGLGDVDHRLDLSRPLHAWKAWWIARRYERIVVQYAPVLIPWPGQFLRRRLAFYTFHLFLYAIFLLARGRDVQIVVHELNRPATTWQREVFGRFWRAAPRLFLHSDIERKLLLKLYPLVRPERTELTSPGDHFVPSFHGTKEKARELLGIPRHQVVFVSCGFIHRAKGFDRPARIFAARQDLSTQAHYYIVGSLIDREADLLEYLRALQELASSSPRVHLVETYLDDETFDAWIVAADYLVCAYTPSSSASSGVIARSRMLGTPVVATRVGPLEQQRPEYLVEDEAELERVLVQLSAQQAS